MSQPTPLVKDYHLSTSPTPLTPPSPISPHVLVIGGGVIGLTSAWALLDRGYRVTIISKDWPTYTSSPRMTSQIAGALWELPPAVCGQHNNPVSLSHSRKWAWVSYALWWAITEERQLSGRAGVRVQRSVFFFPYLVEKDPSQLSKMIELQQGGIRDFTHDPNLGKETGVSPTFGIKDAYSYSAPTIDTDVAMTWLLTLVLSKGATLKTHIIHGDIFTQEHALRTLFNADAIVNATGLAAQETAGDLSCFPLRGALIRVINDGSDFEKVTDALAISADAVNDPEDANAIVFIVPRNENTLILGGIAQPHEWNLDLTLSSPSIQRMKDRCVEFLPRLKNAKLDEVYPFAQGLRPFRESNVRVERELRRHEGKGSGEGGNSRIVHSYGHGGAGWSLSFGCALDVVGLVEMALADLPARPMQMKDSKL